jgi:hypothetical protein
MSAHRNLPLIAYLVGLLFLAAQAACGSSAYLIEATNLARPNPQGIPAQVEKTGEPVFVSPRKMYLDRPEPLAPPSQDGHLRVRPRRPKGLLIAGSITFGIGTVLTLAGVGQIPCPPGALCENGIAIGALLGVGSFHMLIGGIQLIAAAAKWSPEVSRPYAY